MYIQANLSNTVDYSRMQHKRDSYKYVKQLDKLQKRTMHDLWYSIFVKEDFYFKTKIFEMESSCFNN